MKNIARPLLFALVVLSSFMVPYGIAQPADISPPTVDLSIYRQVVEVCFVVKDLDRTLEFWEKLGLRNIHRLGIHQEPHIRYRGRISPLTLKIAYGNIGGVRVTWIEPIHGASDLSDFLSHHGIGVHHLTFAVENKEEMNKQIQYFHSKGVDAVMQGDWERGGGGASFVDLDTAQRGGGITFELVYDPVMAAARTSLTSSNEDPFNRLTQYAFAVRDIEKTGEFYEGLGFGATAHDYIDYSSNPERYYREAPGKFTIFVGYWRWGTVNFEWIQPSKGPSVFDEYLKNHGEGIQHLAVEVGDMDQALASMSRKGLRVAQSGVFNYQNRRGRFAFIDAEPETGVMIEFIWRAAGNR